VSFIRGTVDDVGYFCERADEIHFVGGIMEKIVEQYNGPTFSSPI
jgi:hypothetical protein